MNGVGSGNYIHKKSGVVKNLTHVYYDNTGNSDGSGLTHVYSVHNKQKLNPDKALQLEMKNIPDKKSEPIGGKMHEFMFSDLKRSLEFAKSPINNMRILQQLVRTITSNNPRFKDFCYKDFNVSFTPKQRNLLIKTFLKNYRVGAASDIEPTDGVDNIQKAEDMKVYACVIIKNNEDKVLFLKRSSKDTFQPSTWCLPGGSVETGESPTQAAVREVKEETNLKVEKTKFLYEFKTDTCNIFYFEGEVGIVEGDLILNNESDEFAWLSPDEWVEYDLLLDLGQHLDMMVDQIKKGDDILEYLGISNKDTLNIVAPTVHTTQVDKDYNKMTPYFEELLNTNKNLETSVVGKPQAINWEKYVGGTVASTSKAQNEVIREVMTTFNSGKLVSAHTGEVVTDRKQAIAFAFKQAQCLNKAFEFLVHENPFEKEYKIENDDIKKSFDDLLDKGLMSGIKNMAAKISGGGGNQNPHSAQVGEERTWSGKKYKKQQDGSWKPVGKDKNTKQEDEPGEANKYSHYKDDQIASHAKNTDTDKLQKFISRNSGNSGMSKLVSAAKKELESRGVRHSTDENPYAKGDHLKNRENESSVNSKETKESVNGNQKVESEEDYQKRTGKVESKTPTKDTREPEVKSEAKPRYKIKADTSESTSTKKEESKPAEKSETKFDYKTYHPEAGLSDKIKEKITKANSEQDPEKQAASKKEAKQKIAEYQRSIDNVLNGNSKGLLVYGQGGLGKSYNIEKALEKKGLKKDEDYFTIKSGATSSGVYKMMHDNPDAIFIFDDCDSLWDKGKGENLLKSALDSRESRRISDTKGTGKTDAGFDFTGKVIFASNKTEDFFNQSDDRKAILSRIDTNNLSFTPQQSKEMVQDLLKNNKIRWEDYGVKSSEVSPEDIKYVSSVLDQVYAEGGNKIKGGAGVRAVGVALSQLKDYQRHIAAQSQDKNADEDTKITPEMVREKVANKIRSNMNIEKAMNNLISSYNVIDIKKSFDNLLK